MHGYRFWALALGASLAIFALSATVLYAESPPMQGNEQCLACHSNPNATYTLPSQEKLSLYVDQKTFSSSIHGTKVRCVDCHEGYSGYPHPKLTVQDKRSYVLGSYGLCKKCHSASYSKAQDSMHAEVLSGGNKAAPVCTDCHGAHNVTNPHQPRTKVSETCAKCHESIYKDYTESVHGHALTEGNRDVPVCTDCHGVHNIQDPRTAQFRIQSPEMCAGCHTDEKLMSKYNLSTEVYATYREDFHGATVEFYRTRWPTIWCYKAVCTDCHGIHDIKHTHDPASSVAPANLHLTCAKCHQGANPNFARAWTGHYKPDPERAPLTYYVQLFYNILIPTLICGFVAYIALDLGRTAVNRVRGGNKK